MKVFPEMTEDQLAKTLLSGMTCLHCLNRRRTLKNISKVNIKTIYCEKENHSITLPHLCKHFIRLTH